MLRDRLLPGLLRGCAPLLVWAAHFAVCYTAAALRPDDVPRAPLLAVTALALAGESWLLWRAWPRARLADARLRDRAAVTAAALALPAVLWTGLPLLLS
jgi:hypothetical protein